MRGLGGVSSGGSRGAGLAGALVDLVLPGRCGACAAPGPPCCAPCAESVSGLLALGATGPVAPTPAPAGFPTTFAYAAYDDPLRSLLTAYKDRDRRDLRPVLARWLGAPLAAAAAEARARALSRGHGAHPDVLLVVPVPSSPASVRRRGDRPLDDLVLATLRAARPQAEARLVFAPALRVARRVADQSGLNHEERERNVDGAFAVVPAWAPLLPRVPVLLVDDVVTTGATLAEAARSLTRGGVTTLAAAAVAATQRRA